MAAVSQARPIPMRANLVPAIWDSCYLDQLWLSTPPIPWWIQFKSWEWEGIGDARPTSCSCGIPCSHSDYHVLHTVSNTRLTNCFCGIAWIHAPYAVLHMSGNIRLTSLLSWDRPISWHLLCFEHTRRYQTDKLLLLQYPYCLHSICCCYF